MIGSMKENTAYIRHDDAFRKALNKLTKGDEAFFKQYLIDNNITELHLASNYRGGLSRATSCIIEMQPDNLQLIFKALAGTPVKKIDISNTSLGFEKLSNLVPLLKTSNVTSLNLRGNMLDGFHQDEDTNHLYALAQALVDSNIDSVNLSANNITPQVTIKLLEVLKQKNYKELDLSNNPLSNGIVTELTGLNTKTLNLAGTALTSEDAVELAAWVKTHPVVELNIEENALSQDAMEALVNAVPQSKLMKLQMEDKAMQAKAELMAKKRLLTAYYNSTHAQIKLPTVALMNERQKELVVAFDILAKVPADLRGVILDFASSHSKKSFSPLRNALEQNVVPAIDSAPQAPAASQVLAAPQASQVDLVPVTETTRRRASFPVRALTRTFSNIDDAVKSVYKTHFGSSKRP